MSQENCNKIAVFPGSFDPITVGHESIITRALPLFDKIIVAVGVNATKQAMFTVEERKAFIRKTFESEAKIEVTEFSGLTVEFCREHQAQFILRGLRTSADFEFERSIGQVNKILDAGLETIFMLTSTAHTPITSSVVRDVVRHKGDISSLVPKAVLPMILEKY
jgi:pantetheine-phosphate adenylyltransferase